MLVQKIKKGVLSKKDWWFCEKPSFHIFSSYIQSPKKMDIPLMKRTPFYTIHINLNKSENELLTEMDKGTSYEIRRAEREGITCDAKGEAEVFIDFFNGFANEKGIEGVSEKYTNFNEPMVFTRAFYGDDLLVMHAYVEDKQRGRLNMSASRPIRKDENFKKTRALIGYANRYLHFQDILYFKSKKKEIYDFGGYAKGTKDKSLEGINKFKLGFGGEVVEEYNYRFIFLP